MQYEGNMEEQKRIDGKLIAAKILEQLRIEVLELKRHDKTPNLQVFLIGDDPASKSYIAQKNKAAETIGATLTVTELASNTEDREFFRLLTEANTNPKITGIIIQRPLPRGSDIKEKTLLMVNPKKDIDGFGSKSPFEVPVARAVLEFLEHIYSTGFDTHTSDFISWLRLQTVVVIGKGETAGGPIIKLLERLSVSVMVVDRSTKNPNAIIKSGTIIISCVGKPGIVTSKHIKEGAVLLSVGLSRVEGKLVGDYDEADIAPLAKFYTPTPGGVGPVNVACLMKNLVEASKME
jgi:methylenetetrahydrofolate dehydrogenase (NADP+) / methenyltetrahydrofolate cyclohydrolase